MLTPALTAAELGALLAFATAMSFTPGPNTTLSAALAANGGLRAAMPFVLSVPVGWGLLLAAAAAGLGAALQAEPMLRGAIQALGLAYMLWLAWKLATMNPSTSAGGYSGDTSRGAALAGVGFGHGVLLQFVNIKAWLNALLVSAGWVTVAEPAGDRVLDRLTWVLPIMMAYAFASNFTYALAGAALRRWLSEGRRLQVFNRLLAAMLVATAVWMATL